MARELRRLLIAPPRLAAADTDPPRLALSADERHYLERVLRYGHGDRFAVVDGQGHRWSAQLLPGGLAQLEQPLAAPLEVQPQPRPTLVLAAAVVKRDYEQVVRMAVELGVDRLIPLISEHSAVQGQLRGDRWRTIAVEAAEQSERLWLPTIDPPTPLVELMAADTNHEASSAGGSVVGPVIRLWCTTRNPDLPGLLDRLLGAGTGSDRSSALDTPSATSPDALWLACGPEGGWSLHEDAQAAEAGWQAVQMGPRILRSSTASVCALGAISLWRARLFGC